ncbi:hypothetical protein [Paracidobacterium acidisoli]|uniref:Peptidase M48 domain-containing protein n=1 Tax=Paracidobacterium acidisoli TaxID=2303751 RepID=A0A372ITE9_9BACT|nr:hypothetical protein [Paracidobacterium acidisoli]MBT9329607.1 hypothetical protein [Paracidobacterium acidisoli]
MFRKLTVLGLAVSVSFAAAYAKTPRTSPLVPLTPQQTELVQKAIARERATVAQIRKSTPVVQSYIQDMRPDPKLYQIPVSDQYMLGRVDFGKTFNAEEYSGKKSSVGFFKGSLKFVSGLTDSFHMKNSATGFMDMMFVDPSGFDLQHYDFSYVRREFLGNVRTIVFDVRPKTHTGNGRFFGRIWVEDQDGNIVRFNGAFTDNSSDDVPHYFHFDSWRMNVQQGLWLPAAIYVEDTIRAGKGSKAESLRGQTYYWGYSLKLPTRETDNESMEIDNAQDQSANSADVSPLQAQREWVSQAEQNVLDRLTQAGLIAPPSDFDKVLETVTNNIIIGNKLALPNDIHCRVILTTPLESMSVGNTILLSKGLVDVLPTEEDLAAVLSFQLAHIILGHRIDTRYAFNDRLLFPDEAAFQRIHMDHSVIDNEAAAKKAVELFNNSVYHDKAGSVGLFFEQLRDREKPLNALLTPRLGDSLVREDGSPWLSGLMPNAPRLDMDNLNQIAALPLNSHLKIDPWDDKVIWLNVKPVTLLNARDKMPLEITPVYFRLQRYQIPADLPAGATQGTAAPPPADAGAGAAAAPPAADAGNAQPQQQ